MTNRGIPLELQQLKSRLLELFSTNIKGTGSNDDECEANFFSKALAAFTVYNNCDCTIEDAANSVVDGNGDGGIDAIHYCMSNNTLYLVQSKYRKDAHGTPQLEGMLKFKEGITNIINKEYSAFSRNIRMTAKLNYIDQFFRLRDFKIRAIIAYSSIDDTGEDEKLCADTLQKTYAHIPNFFEVNFLNLNKIHQYYIIPSANIDQDIILEFNTILSFSHKNSSVYCGFVSNANLASIYEEFGINLVSSNIRNYIGNTIINQRIMDTLNSEADFFHFYNNGLTAYCLEVYEPPENHRVGSIKRLVTRGLSVVNGAQTLGSIHKFKQSGHALEGYTFIKIILLNGEYNREDIKQKITARSNYQNQINDKNFAALDRNQKRIHDILQRSGIYYHYKPTENQIDDVDESFDIDEATIALACRISDSTCDLVAKVLSNRKTLFSFEPVPQSPYNGRSRYELIFNDLLPALAVWRAVLIMRIVRKTMSNEATSSTGRLKTFFQNSRWLILHIIFIRLKYDQGDSIKLTAEEEKNIVSATLDIANIMWSYASLQPESTHFKSIFSSPADCTTLKARTMAHLNRPKA